MLQLLLKFFLSNSNYKVQIQEAQQIHQQTHPKIPEVQMPNINIPSSSIIIEASSSKKTDLNFIHLINPPKVHILDQLLEVEYSCQPGDVMGVDVMAIRDNRKDVKLFDAHWECQHGLGNVQTMFVRVQLPDKATYRPDFLIRQSFIAKQLNYRLWVVSKSVFNMRRKQTYELSLANSVYLVQLMMPYSRPRKNHNNELCLRWNTQILMKYRENDVLTCAYESGT